MAYAISYSTFQANRNKENSDDPVLASSPSVESQLPVFDDSGVDVRDDEKGGDEALSDDEEDNKLGLKINNACLKPGLNSQS